ncbi:hypothetical protein Taro_028879 [Colocasia esculenta]|uniref:Uncharacterized protein n=1 Tax=Colocasia esculenta TaxID=4460 RepID=A0A843VT72_COLES|nr:hypothetical protein [Colocasia esculenta]
MLCGMLLHCKLVLKENTNEKLHRGHSSFIKECHIRSLSRPVKAAVKFMTSSADALSSVAWDGDGFLWSLLFLVPDKVLKYFQVYNGMTQLGFEQAHREFSFGTEQTHVSLYLTAISSLSELVGKPMFKVYPEKGLEVRLSGSGADGRAPTTLSPTVLTVNWRCEDTHDKPYEVLISIPVEGYGHVEFTLSKLCEYRQTSEGEAMRGWATLGVTSCVLIVLSTVACCGGFIYRTRVEHQRGLDALPGMTILSACLEAVTGPRGYAQPGDVNGAFVHQPPWENASTSQVTQRPNERKYGSI